VSEKSRRTLLACLETLELQVDPALIHQVPGAFSGYASSSYNAELSGFVTPSGGYGPPRDINASFSHDHTEPSFKKLHPNVDTGAYNAPPSPPSPRRRKSRAKAAVIPKIVITDMDAAKPERRDEPSTAAAQGVSPKPKVEVQETSSALAVDAAIKVEKKANAATPSVPIADTVTVDHAVAAAAAPITVKVENIEDSGIALEDSVVFDNEDDNKTTLQDTRAVPKSDDFNSAADSTYGTQPNADISTQPIHHITTSGSASPEQSRNVLTPKLPYATRRSSRLSAITTDSQPAPESSLGKRTHEDDADTDIPSPKGKRTKATRP
jgi:hypothetical protein